MALAYMLVAPIVNPVVIASTFAAYRAFPTWLLVPFGRIGLGVLLGMVIAAFVGRDRFRRLVRDNAQPDPLPGHAASGDHHHHAPLSRKLSAVADHAVAEFLDVAVFLIAGAAVAAFVQTFVSRAILVNVGHSPVLAVPVMMALAVLLNLCSEADAFVAASFSATFSVASQLAFLVLGPMLDLKLIIMYTMVFRRQLILILVPTILVVIFLAMQAFALAEYLFRAAPGASP